MKTDTTGEWAGPAEEPVEPRLDATKEWAGPAEEPVEPQLGATAEWAGLVEEPVEPQIESFSMGIPADGVSLAGDLEIPKNALGLVLFAHGSGSGRFSARNRGVAEVLQRSGIATLLFDLLTSEEEIQDAPTGHLRFDIRLLARRLVAVTEAVSGDLHSRNLPLAYFGASTGGAAALIAAATLPSVVRAVVSRGGRPDLAGEALAMVKAPTLLIVGERDEQVLRLNEDAFEQLQCQKSLAILPDATHLFEEPGALEEVSRLAAGWFRKHFRKQ